ETIAINERELCKYFEPGNHVKYVSGAQESVTGMVITIEGHLVTIVSDTTKEAVLKGVADRAEVQLVRLRDIKYKIDRKISAQDRYKNTVSMKDVFKVIDGFICTKSQSCILVGSSANGDRNANPLASRVWPWKCDTYASIKNTTSSVHDAYERFWSDPYS
nr:hypothetical protein [Tanacetum cinerariifolium]